MLRLRLEALDKVQRQQLLELSDLAATEKHDKEKDAPKAAVLSDQISVKSDES